MNVDKIKFQKLGTEERKLLLKALDIPLKNMQCYYCAKRLDFRTCGIMPPLKRGEIGRITCSSPLCICEYLEDFENANPSNSATAKTNSGYDRIVRMRSQRRHEPPTLVSI